MSPIKLIPCGCAARQMTWDMFLGTVYIGSEFIGKMAMIPDEILVLVLETDEDVGGHITQLLSNIATDVDPIQISWVQSAEAAMEQLQQLPFTAVLIGLPLTQTIGDGLNLLRQMRQTRPDVPIVALVEAETMGLGLQAIEFGAHAYFPRHQLTPPMLRRIIDRAAARKAVWQEAQAEGSLNRVVFDSLPANVAVLDGEGKITAVNQDWLHLTTTTDDPFITQAKPGVNLPRLCRQTNYHAIAQGIEDVLTGRKIKFTLEYPAQEEERIVWYLICVTALRWPQGGAVFTCQEITETVAQQIQISTYETEIADLRSQFVATVHELRTPLTSINLYLDLIGRANPQKQQHYLSIVRQETNRMVQNVNDILVLSRLEEKGSEQQFMPVDFGGLVQYVVMLQQPVAEAKGLALSLTLGDGPFEMNGRARQLTRLITNLIANAIRYTEAGSVHVELVRDDAANQMRLTVSDSGIGIAPEMLPHIFEPFFRTPRAQQVSDVGTGLGLSIVQKVVHFHNGSIHVSSEMGKGSVFQVWLPVAGKPQA
ncbi:MAG: response regulator [Ardenticatenaceae bacterium]|nr:response regulator [Ardenticatenaceae bacterium]MCB9444511.1 response regulator [Ardenticatenaceae bacterium]